MKQWHARDRVRQCSGLSTWSLGEAGGWCGLRLGGQCGFNPFGDQPTSSFRGPESPHHIASRLTLPEDQLNRIGRELDGLFTATTRHELDDLTVFTATRRSDAM